MIPWLLLACSTAEPPTAPRGPSPPRKAVQTATTADTAGGVNPPNVLILLSDDQGLDAVGVYGVHPHPPPTPRLDQLANEGLRFNNVWGHPVCSPSRAALLTGQLPRRTGAGDTFLYQGGKELRVTEQILPRMLQLAPQTWTTAAIGKWHLGAYNAESSVDHPTLMGFDHFSGTLGNLGDHVISDGLLHGYDHWEHIEDGEVTKNDTYITTYEVDEALRLMDTLPEPWLLYVAFHAPHSPFDVPPDHLTPTLDAQPTDPKPVRYPLLVEALDQEIGRLLDSMGPRRERTLVIFASDNGTPADATLSPWDGNRAKNSPFEGGIRVPMFISGPGVIPGTQTDALVHLADVFATVADVAGVVNQPEVIDGVSLRPLFANPDGPWPRIIVHSEKFGPNGGGPYNHDWRMSRSERWKVIQTTPNLPPALFDLVMGPVEIGPPIVVSSLGNDDRAEAQAVLDAHESFFSTLVEQGP